MTADALLEAVFEGDRVLRKAEQAFLEAKHDAAHEAVRAAVTRDMRDAGEDAAARLALLGELLVRLPFVPHTVDTLLVILGHSHPAVRVTSARALLTLGYERYAELARAAERALAAGLSSHAKEELPWIFAEIGEPSALKLITPLLADPEASVVASAMEALVDLGDPGAIPLLQRLVDDTRVVTVEDADDELTTTVGELAEECVAELEADDE